MQFNLRHWIRVVRSDEQGRAHISGRKIYILPTKYGLIFGVLLLAMLLGALNYANNPAFLLTFLLTGLVIQTIYSTWYNLLGLTIKWRGTEPVFAGKTAMVQMQLGNNKGRQQLSIQLTYDNNTSCILDIPARDSALAKIPFRTQSRGLKRPGRITIETRYPFGLARAWSYLYIDTEILVYPKPAAHWNQINPPAYQGSEYGDRGVGTDDFVGHRGYRPGDSPQHINWKALAAERGLLIKQFGGDRVDTLWLDFEQINAQNTESALSLLCRAILDLEQQQLHYGLRIGATKIPPAHGIIHQNICLKALALYGERE